MARGGHSTWPMLAAAMKKHHGNSKTLSGAYAADLAVGVTLATLSRKAANTINKDTELTCRAICDANPADVCTKAEERKIEDYFEWVDGLKKG
jgi:hydroxymethylpyrimidine/phosphomethylpyrimidine kinase